MRTTKNKAARELTLHKAAKVKPQLYYIKRKEKSQMEVKCLCWNCGREILSEEPIYEVNEELWCKVVIRLAFMMN